MNAEGFYLSLLRLLLLQIISPLVSLCFFPQLRDVNFNDLLTQVFFLLLRNFESYVLFLLSKHNKITRTKFSSLLLGSWKLLSNEAIQMPMN